MPLVKVGKDCYRWGKSGKVYCGKGAKAKALAQGRAIEISKKKKQETVGKS